MPKIINMDLVDRAEEYPVVLPKDLKKLTIQLRPDSEGNEYAFRLAYEEGGTKNHVFLTIRAGSTYWEDRLGGLRSKTLTVYLRCPGADNQKAEILTWP